MADQKLKIVCALATFPKRKASMLKVVSAISPQCDVLCIWLNEYEQIPDELQQYKNLDIRLGGKDNIKDAGKFAFLDKYYDCYYLTIDDDINYPKNYVQRIVRNINRYGKKCIISYHGHAIKQTKVRVYAPFYKTLKHDIIVNIRVGTGVAAFVPSYIHIPIFSLERLHTIDTDVSLSVWASNHGIPMIVCGHKTGWLTNIEIDNVRYDGISKLTGTKELLEKRKIEESKRKSFRKIVNLQHDAEILSYQFSLC